MGLVGQNENIQIQPVNAIKNKNDFLHRKIVLIYNTSFTLRSHRMSTEIITKIDGCRENVLALAGKKNAADVANLFENLKTFILETVKNHDDEVKKEMAKEMNKKIKKIEAKASGKKVKKQRDPNMPKRPSTSYMLYCSENREKVKNENSEMKPKDITTRLGELWNALSEKEKTKYSKKAEKERAVYNKLMDQYKIDHPVISAPKGAMSSYMLFCKDNHDKVVAKHPDTKQTEITKILSEMWKSSDDKVKENYKSKAEEDRKRAVREMEQFKIDHPDEYEEFQEKKKEKREKRAEKKSKSDEEEENEDEE